MTKDPIIEEVRKHRQEYAKQFNYDAKSIVADLRRRTANQPDRVVSYSPKLLKRKQSA